MPDIAATTLLLSRMQQALLRIGSKLHPCTLDKLVVRLPIVGSHSCLAQ